MQIDKVYFKAKALLQVKNINNDKRFIHLEDATIETYVSDNLASKYREEKLTELKEK